MPVVTRSRILSVRQLKQAIAAVGSAARIEQLESRAYFAGVGQGLVGDYYADQALANLALARTDATINFAPTGSPGAGVPAHKYSVRWTGNVLAQFSQTYTFSSTSIGGVRVTVNGKKIIDNWTSHSTAVTNTGTIAFTAGKYYPIQVDYREDGKATMKLSWSSSSQVKQIIPKTQLYQVGSAPIAGGWLEGNIGAETGSVLGAGATTFNVKANAATSTMTADALHFLYRPARGDAVEVAKINPLSAGKEALLARQNLNANGLFAGIAVDANGVSFQSRIADGAALRSTNPIPIGSAMFVKLVKDGNSYAGYLSPSGADGTWQLVGTAGVQMGTFQLFGLATGGSAASSVTANFSTVSLTPVNPIGGNLNSQSDRVQDLAFVDLVKTTRGFYNLAGRKASNGFTDFATTDANGWPTEDFSFTAVDNSEWNAPADTGTYKISFNGPAGIVAFGNAGVTTTNWAWDPATQLYTGDVVVSGSVTKLTLTFTGTQGQVKNIRLLQPGYALSTTKVFTDKYINLIKTTGPSVLRFMDWVKTNGKQDVNWSDRPQVTDATQARAIVPGDLQPLKGIAWEYVVQFANLVGKDVWINIPEHASDDYITQLATLLRNGLRADLNIYVEDSNEVWNTGFEQSGANKTAAVNEVFANANSDLNYDHKTVDTTKPGTSNPQADTWGDRRHARRTKQIADIFKQVFTSAGLDNPLNTRVRAVLSGQASNLSRFDNELTYLKTEFGDPKNYLYGIGIAPYFNLGGTNTKAGATKADILAAMNASVDAYQNGTTFSTAFSKANTYGIKLLAYEGGPDTYGAVNIAAKKAASLDPAIQGIIARYLHAWYTKGGELFNYYTIGARSYDTPYGDWSITDDLDNLTAPKIKAFQQIRDEYPVSTTVKGVYA